jgi:hypothetical protein
MAEGDNNWQNPSYSAAEKYDPLNQYGLNKSLDVYNSFADNAGNRVNDPTAWAQTQNELGRTMAGGDATDTSDAYKKAKMVAERDTQLAIDQAAEQAGLGGTRWSSSMGRTAQDIAGGKMAELGSTFAQQAMGAQEAARGRELQAAGQMYNLGQGQAGLGENAMNRWFQSGQGLLNQGQAAGRNALDYASALENQGSGIQQSDQSAINAYLQNYLRESQENDPWLSMANQYASTSGQPNQYQQGGVGTALGMFSSLLPFLGML